MKLHLPSLLRKALLACVVAGFSFSASTQASEAFELTFKVTKHTFNGYATSSIIQLQDNYYLMSQAGSYLGLSAKAGSMTNGTNDPGANKSGEYDAENQLHTITATDGELPYGWISLNNSKGSAAYGVKDMTVTIKSGGGENSLLLDFDGANENDTLVNYGTTEFDIDNFIFGSHTICETQLKSGTWNLSQSFTSDDDTALCSFTVDAGAKIIVGGEKNVTIKNLICRGTTQVQEGGNLTINGGELHTTITNNGTITVGGVVKVSAERVNNQTFYSDGDNGYATVVNGYMLGDGFGTWKSAEGVTWQKEDGTAISETLNEHGVLGTGGAYGTEYWVNSEVTYDGSAKFDAATQLKLNNEANGILWVKSSPTDNLKITASAQGGSIYLQDSTTLQQSAIGNLEGKVYLTGDTNTAYALGDNVTGLATNLILGGGWEGTIKVSGSTTSGLSLASLGNNKSTIDIEGNHTLATGTDVNKVTANLTGSGTLTSVTGVALVFQKDGGKVDVKIKGGSDIKVEKNTAFSSNVSAATFGAGTGATATISGIVTTSKIYGNIVGEAAASAQNVSDDRVAEHGVLVAQNTTDGISLGGTTVLKDTALATHLNNQAGNLTVSGEMKVDAALISADNFKDTSVYYTGEWVGDTIEYKTTDTNTANKNGFKAKVVEYTILKGEDYTTGTEGVTWTVAGDEGTYSYDSTNKVGVVRVSEAIDTSTYWVESKEGVAVKITDIGSIVPADAVVMLKGGVLEFDITGRSTMGGDLFAYKFATNNTEITDTKQLTSTIKLTDGALMKIEDFVKTESDDANNVISTKSMIAEGTTLLLEGTEQSKFLINQEIALLEGIQLSQNWYGVVISTGEIGKGQGDLTALTNTNTDISKMSTLQMGSIDTDVLSVGGNLSVAGNVTVSEGASKVGGYLALGQDLALEDNGFELLSLTAGTDSAPAADSPMLTLGAAATGATLTVGGELTTPGGITFAHADSRLTAGSVSGSTLDVWIDENTVLDEMASQSRSGRLVLVTLTEGAAATPTANLNGKAEQTTQPGDKYTPNLTWDGNELVFTAIPNEDYLTIRNAAVLNTANGAVGAALLGAAYAESDPQYSAPDGDLATLLNAADAAMLADEDYAAAAGASTAALGVAYAGDVERQLRAIRNRTTTMGVNQCVINEDMPYFNAWINAEGNRAELDQDGTMAGYTLDNWGGTVGFDVDVNPNLTVGMAVTAMYGDLTADGPDMLDGDLDTYYISAFARYAKRAWTHTFVATVGTMDSTYERTVSHACGSYRAEGDTDGTAFGLMYEVGRTFTLDRDGDVAAQLIANVAYRHTTVNGYEETGTDAALKVDDQTLDTVTLGVGGRLQAVVGENAFNRTALLETRALAKFDVGDRSSEADVAFLAGSRSATVESAELGAFGVELGAGLSIPVGDENDGTLFFDVSAELRSGYTNVNGTIGYRINF